jgi:hypothetical protein
MISGTGLTEFFRVGLESGPGSVGTVLAELAAVNDAANNKHSNQFDDNLAIFHLN